VIDALGTPQSILLLGGTSDIGLSIAELFASRRGLRVALAGRSPERLSLAAERLSSKGCATAAYPFDALDVELHGKVIGDIFRDGDIDVAVVAFGVLGVQEEAETDSTAAVRIAMTNYVGAVSVGVALQNAMRAQGHGVIIALSSVAAERPRRSNFIYGSSKSGLDAFYTGLGEALLGSGVRVIVVRPGFVRTKMTQGRKAAPLATSPGAVAEAVAAAIRREAATVWVPPQLRFVMAVLRHLPRAVFRRLPS
jgi:decaprenylphospho-beta-D-erythro-pentofuranosid-2-ulose 2-reductase